MRTDGRDPAAVSPLSLAASVDSQAGTQRAVSFLRNTCLRDTHLLRYMSSPFAITPKRA
jgi:hypothetical protein